MSSFYFTNSEEKVKEMEFALDVEKLSSTRLRNELAQHPQDTDPEKKEEKKRKKKEAKEEALMGSDGLGASISKGSHWDCMWCAQH